MDPLALKPCSGSPRSVQGLGEQVHKVAEELWSL